MTLTKTLSASGDLGGAEPTTTSPRRPEHHLRPAIRLLLRASYLGIGLLAIGFWTYLFGHALIEGGIKGSDSGYALSLITWIDRWFPSLPAWYPLQGVGSSGILQYPYGAHYFVVAASRATGLSLAQTFRLTQLGSVVATAWGIYVLVWKKLGNQTMALIAGLFYPISMAAWKWLAAVGLFGQSVSIAWFAPTLLLFDAYISSGFDDETGVGRRRLTLLACAVLYCLMMLTHLITAIVFGMTIFLYSLLIRKAHNRISGWRAVGIRVRRAAVAAGLGIALASFWLVPFLRIRGLVNRDGPVAESSMHQIPYLNLLAAAGVVEHQPTRSLASVTFASPVLLLAAVGVVLSVRRSSFVSTLAIISIVVAVFTAIPGVVSSAIAPLERLWAILYGREIIPSVIFLPIIAGYGAVALPMRAFQLPRILATIRSDDNQSAELGFGVRSWANSPLVGGVGLAIALAAFLFLRYAPPGNPDYQGYGLPSGEVWWPFRFSGNSIDGINWPEFKISDDNDPNAALFANDLTGILELDASARIHLSPSFGGALEVLPLYSDVSSVPMYYYQGKLNSPMLGYMAEVYWNEEYGSTHELDEFARWFDVNFVVLNADSDPIDKYDDLSWTPIALPDERQFSDVVVLKFNEAPGLATIRSSPQVLVIGGHEDGNYEQVFRLFNGGLMRYDEGTVVEGSHLVDDYDLDELLQFSVVFLRGYGYRDRDTAWELLANYVKGGGSLYVDTGWQYRVPEWEMVDAPPVLPVTGLAWSSVQPSDQLSLGPSLQWLQGDVEAFAPMSWHNQPWGVSAPVGPLRDWATTVLEADGRPLVAAGQYGNGKVVWSGMNLVGHILLNDNLEESLFLRSLLQWMLPAVDERPSPQIEVHRDSPDKVELRIAGPIERGTYVLWSENHTPDWSALVKSAGREEPATIYRAGPGIMLVQLPASSAPHTTVTLAYSLAAVRGLGIGITVLTVMLLLGSVVWSWSWSKSADPVRSPAKRLRDGLVPEEIADELSVAVGGARGVEP